jgi:hypothetical protein
VKSIFAVSPLVGYVHQLRNCFRVGPTQLLDEVLAAQSITESVDCSLIEDILG